MVGQDGPVFYLAGVWNVSGSGTRSCNVPCDRALFFPILNCEQNNVEMGPATVKELRAACAGWIETIIALEVEVDGVSLPDLLLLKDFELDTIQVTEGGGERKSVFIAYWVATFVFIMVLYMSFMMYGSSIIRGILEEKTARIIEVLLATFSPFELLLGKILGLGLVGLTQVGVYCLAVGGLMAAGAWGGQSARDPRIAEFLNVISLPFMIYFGIFFILGYFLYAAMFATVGSLCNSEQEAQNMQWPVVMSLLIPLVSTMFLIQNPDTTITRVLSLIPLFTPMVMFMRISNVTPPFWEIALSIGLLIAFILGFTWVASRIFRVAILMYGKRPTAREIFRWVRAV